MRSGRNRDLHIGIWVKVVRGLRSRSAVGFRHGITVNSCRVLSGRFSILSPQRRRHQRIKRDYGMSIADFYSASRSDLTKLAERYGIRFTGRISRITGTIRKTLP